VLVLVVSVVSVVFLMGSVLVWWCQLLRYYSDKRNGLPNR